MMFRWCSCGVSVVSRCRSAGPVVSGVRVLSQWYPDRFPVVSRWCCRMSSGVSVVSRWLVSQSQWCPVLLCVSVVSQCCSSIATRFGVYFLHGLCSCLRPFSENVRFGVPVFFPLGVPVVSRWCPCGVAVVSQWCLGGVMVLSQWCSGGVPMVLRWCSVSRWCLGVTLLVRSCLGRVPVVSQWCPGHIPWCPGRLQCVQCCPGGVPVVGAPVVSRWCRSGVSWCSSGVQWCPGGWCPSGVSKVFQCCSSGVLVVSRASWVLVVFHPVVSRSCPVFHAVVSRSRPPFRKICDCGAVGVLLVRWLVGLRWGGAGG